MGQQVTKLDTTEFQNIEKDFKNAVEQFQTLKNDVLKAKNDYLSSWKGKAKTEFDAQWDLTYRKIGDLYDSLFDIYNAMVEAEATYIDADETYAKLLDTGRET